MSIIGQNIRRLRLERGLSQAALASKAKVAQSLIGSLEKNSVQSTKKLSAIARALEVSPFEIDPDLDVNAGDLPGDMAHGSSLRSKNTNSKTPLMPAWIEETAPVPVFATSIDGSLSTVRRKKPAAVIDRLSILRYSENPYGLIVPDISMAPEFYPGDIAIIDPSLPALQDTTCVLYKDEHLEVYKIARIEADLGDAWLVSIWCHEGQLAKIRAAKTDWAICHRIVCKFYRG